jgi:hypothetical protein
LKACCGANWLQPAPPCLKFADQQVTLSFRIADSAAPALVAQLNEAASGQLGWAANQHE